MTTSTFSASSLSTSSLSTLSLSTLTSCSKYDISSFRRQNCSFSSTIWCFGSDPNRTAALAAFPASAAGAKATHPQQLRVWMRWRWCCRRLTRELWRWACWSRPRNACRRIRHTMNRLGHGVWHKPIGTLAPRYYSTLYNKNFLDFMKVKTISRNAP